MSLNYRDRVSNGAQFKRFAIVRFARLYPVHLTFLILFFAIEVLKFIAAQNGISSPNTVPFRENSMTAAILQIFLLHGLGFVPNAVLAFNYPSWSISTEYYTYLIFGSLLLLFGAKRLSKVAVLAAVVTLAVWELLPASLLSAEAMLRCLLGFFVGCALEKFRSPSRDASVAFPSAVLILIVLFLTFYDSMKPQLIMISLAAVLILAVIKSNPIPWLEAGPLRNLGLISYSLYMSHALVLWFVNQVLRFVFKFPEASGPKGMFPAIPLQIAIWAYSFTIVTCIVVAALTYYLIEAPSVRLAKRMNSRPSSQSTK